MKNLFTTTIFLLSISTYAQVGIGTSTPATTLDVNGAITNRETQVTLVGNTANIPANTSMVQLVGTATAAIDIVAPAAPNAGQRLIIFNNTTGGFGSTLNAVTIPANMAGEFVYSNGAWRSINAMGLPSINSGAIIPYASGIPIVLTTVAGGLVGLGSLVGFGNSITGIGLADNNIDITGALNDNFAFNMPRSGVLKSISVYFSNTVALSLIGSSTIVKAQLYSNNGTSNVFVPVPGATVSMPAYSGLIGIGSIRNAMVTGLSIPVSAQSRYLLFFSCTATGLSLVNTVVGIASAGVSVE